MSEKIGHSLRSLRQDAEMGIKGVGPKVGVSYTYLSKVENGLKSPSRGLVIKLCELYGTSSSQTEELLKIVDEIAAVSGSVPSDVKRIIQTHGEEVFELIRTQYADIREGVDDNEKD
ncbi:MAG: helix-turn-helix transcriptional regulator [Candidatus Thiodiazotropha sp.]